MYSLDWPYAYGNPISTASFKLVPDDFQVNEYFAYPFSGEGEHIILKIEKRGITTEEMIKSLARLINKPTKLISYAGLKDRQALSVQWISIHAPGEVIDGIEKLQTASWRVIDSTRHHKKLRPGYLAGNHFIIRLRELTNKDDLVRRIEHIKLNGVPNYFGDQRFGREGGNLGKAEQLLVQGKKVKDKFLRGLYCSTARSWIYNLILAERVKQLNWNRPLVGDVIQLAGSNSIFTIDEIDDAIIQRLKERDISPATPLPGRKKEIAKGEADALIKRIYADWLPWLAGLERLGLEESWRANILYPTNLTYCFESSVMELSFNLPAGSYATAVLRELVQVSRHGN